jgi:pimeloyl-ACP methyl ester carboxylesterase
MGGAVAIELAIRHPEAAGLIVHNSFTSMVDMVENNRLYAIFSGAVVADAKV